MGGVLRATYQDRIEQAIKISQRENKSPGDLIVDIMAALGHNFGDPEMVNRQWAAHYAERDTRAVDAEKARLDLVAQIDAKNLEISRLTDMVEDLVHGERF